MKPIRLTIAGLHSFRQKETIDFEKLCEGGLFGIFTDRKREVIDFRCNDARFIRKCRACVQSNERNYESCRK